METLLLTAKYIAHKEKSNIGLVHFKAAAECLEPIKGLTPAIKKAAKTLLEAIDNIDVAPHELSQKYCKKITSSVIHQVASMEIIEFTDELRDLFKYGMEHPGFPNQLLQFEFEKPQNFFQIKNSPNKYLSQLQDFEQLKQTLLTEVFGQDLAVEELIDVLAKSAWEDKKNQPKGIFLFLGPPATGKTFLAERFAHHLGEDYQFKSFDMTQYTNANEAFGLVGSREGYTDATPGKLTQFLKKHPKSIILFDEFEKAHSQVLLGLLELLSKGTLTDQHTNEEIDCRDTIIIFTSNLGASIYNNSKYLELLEHNPRQARSSLLSNIAKETKIEREDVVKAIPAALLSRLSQGSVLLFKKLAFDQLNHIASQKIKNDISRFSKSTSLKITLPKQSLSELIIFGFAPVFDVREIKSHASSLIIDPITDLLRTPEGQGFQNINCVLSEQAIDWLKTTDFNELQKHLSIKHKTIHFEIKETISNDTLTLTFEDVSEEKIVFSSDIGISGGLSIDIPEISFNDIAGHNFIKERLMETVSLLKNRSHIKQLKVAPPHGMLLYGPPGTGKTMLAKAFANEANLPFISCSGNDLLTEKFIGEIFQRARDYAPSIIFIDEIDALPKRGNAGAWADSLINKLLTEIDGFNTSDQEIFIIGATNFKDKLDDALIRSGRLDLHFKVPHLDKEARRWFIEKQLKHDLYESNIDIEQVLLVTAGLSGADLEKAHRESVLRAVRENLSSINQDLLIEEINILKYGAKRSKESSAQALKETAYHEAAHAVVSKILLPERAIEQITVVAHENTLGMVSYDQEQELDHTKEFLFSLTCIALAGRAAQVKKFAAKGLDTGASSDLRQAMHYAWLATVRYGMTEDSYNMDLSALHEISKLQLFQPEIESLIKNWIQSATEKTESLVNTHWEQIEVLANTLLKKEILGEKELSNIIEKHRPTQANVK